MLIEFFCFAGYLFSLKFVGTVFVGTIFVGPVFVGIIVFVETS